MKIKLIQENTKQVTILTNVKKVCIEPAKYFDDGDDRIDKINGDIVIEFHDNGNRSYPYFDLEYFSLEIEEE